jgi:hypothetical protein
MDYVDEALCYKPEDRGFDFRLLFFGFLYLPNSSSRIIALGSTQSITEISTRNISGRKEHPALKADNLKAICDEII